MQITHIVNDGRARLTAAWNWPDNPDTVVERVWVE